MPLQLVFSVEGLRAQVTLADCFWEMDLFVLGKV
jgi:hypothetical protein